MREMDEKLILPYATADRMPRQWTRDRIVMWIFAIAILSFFGLLFLGLIGALVFGPQFW